MLGKHVIDRDQDLVGNGNYGPLIAATCRETEKLVSQISPLARAAALAASTSPLFRYTLPLGMRLLLRLPAGSLLPGQTPAQEANCETFPNTLISTPNSAMITAARVQSTPGISSNKVRCAA